MDYPGKLIRKTPLVPTQTSASGVWTMTDAMDAVKANSWPVAGIPKPMQQSLRFRSSSTAYLNRTFGSPTSNNKWTWSGWVKRGTLGAQNGLFGAWRTTAGVVQCYFQTNDTLRLYMSDSSNSTALDYQTSQVFRDPSAWYHVVVAVDNTLSTTSAVIYINGTAVTSYGTSTNTLSQNAGLAWNYSGTAGYIGQNRNTANSAFAYLDGYMAEVNFVDGQQLTSSSFGRTDPITGVWQAIPYTGTYGANGFYLNFSNNASTATLGYDTSGNANNWTTNNFSTAAGTVTQTFSSTGTTSWTAPDGVTSVSYLVVAGGGGGGGYGGDNVGGGGGGAGGLKTGSLTVSPGTAYTVTVGAGGGPGTNGSDSVFSSITSTGGGKGGQPAGGNGGSGGGAGAATGSGAAIGTGTAGQGNNGGLGSGDWGTTVTTGGGGGGSGGAGGAASGSTPGTGGSGTASSISGSSVTYAAGGAGAYGASSSGGTSGTANTGNGGQARGGQGGGSAGSGGSGIVILSYSLPGAGSTYDSVVDVPTAWQPAGMLNGNSNVRSNYCVMNPLFYQLGGANFSALSNANLTITGTSSANSGGSIGTMSSTTGKFYYEFNMVGVDASGYCIVGASDVDQLATLTSYNYLGYGSKSYGYNSSGNKTNNNGNASYGASYTTNDIISVALDCTNGAIYFAKNGVWQASGDPTSGASKTNAAYTWTAGSQNMIPQMDVYRTGSIMATNFGQRPFAYTPPSGFLPLNTYNLPASTIVKGNTVMDATLYTGNGTSQSITNAAGFKPDFVWLKARSNAYTHVLVDSIRGTDKVLSSASTSAENSTNAGEDFTAFNSNGFSVGTPVSFNSTNANGATIVGWQWQAGQGSTSSNTSGSITSTVSVNASAGFSVVTYTGNGTSGATVGHGLGVAPSMIIQKCRSNATDWNVYHSSLGATKVLYLDLTDNAFTSSVFWNNTAPTSSVFSLGNSAEVNGSTRTNVAYCWSEVAGFSKFGSYTGNGSTDGIFLYLGFRPKFVMIKSTGTQDWVMLDSSRSPYNVAGNYLRPNSSGAENGGSTPTTSTNEDFLSNGIKFRNDASSSGYTNANGVTYIYMAFAESPFKNSLAR